MNKLSFGRFVIREPKNEPVLDYAPNSWERKELKKELQQLMKQTIDLPLIINGKEIHTETKIDVRAPHDHSLLLGKASLAGKDEINEAIKGALKAKEEWMEFNWDEL